MSSLHKFGSCPSVRPFVHLFVHPSVTFFHSVAKRSPNFTKSSAYVYKVWSPLNCFCQCMCTGARTAHETVHATFVPFAIFFNFFFIFKPFLTEKKKHASVGYQHDTMFSFYAFFPFQSGSPPKWVQKWSKYYFFHPSGQICKS